MFTVEVTMKDGTVSYHKLTRKEVQEKIAALIQQGIPKDAISIVHRPFVKF